MEEIQFELTKIKQRIHELQAIHDKHMNRPSFDDTMEEEHEIEIMTQEITQVLAESSHYVHTLKKRHALYDEVKNSSSPLLHALSHGRLTATLGSHYTHQQPYKEGLQVDTDI